MMIERWVEICNRRDLKVNANKSKVKVLRGEEGSVCMGGGNCNTFRSKLKYPRFVLEVSGTDGVESCKKVAASGEKVTSVVGSLVNGKDLLLECARVVPDCAYLNTRE